MNNNNIKAALDAWRRTFGYPPAVSPSMADLLAAAGFKEEEDFTRYRYITKEAIMKQTKGKAG